MPASTKVASARCEHVVLLDERGRATGTAAKATAHTAADRRSTWRSPATWSTADGRVLLTRRALDEAHLAGRVDERLLRSPPARRDAARGRRAPGGARSSGCTSSRAAVALPDFAYRAEMPDGTVEHELCPVVVARGRGRARRPTPTRSTTSCGWRGPTSSARGDREPWSLSPWSVEQVRQLAGLGVDAARLARRDRPPRCAGAAPRPSRSASTRRLDDAAADRRPTATARSARRSTARCASTLDGFLAEKAAETDRRRPRLARGDRRDPARSSPPAASGCARPSSTGATGPPAPPTTTPCSARRPPSSCCTRSPCSTTT